MRVNVVVKPGWILERMARELEPLGAMVNAGKPERTAVAGAINYYMPARDVEKFPAPGPKVGLYTHGDTAFGCAGDFDACVTMNRGMATRLRADTAAKRIVTIRPGTEAPKRKPVFGVCGRVYGKGRKGEEFVRLAVSRGFDFRACTDFKGHGARPPCRITHSVEQRQEFYQTIDYLVVTSLEEGGPMPVLEAIAARVPVIAPDVGWCWEFPVIRYARGSWKSLHNTLKALSSPPSWKAWTEQHRALFAEIGK